MHRIHDRFTRSRIVPTYSTRKPVSVRIYTVRVYTRIYTYHEYTCRVGADPSLQEERLAPANWVSGTLASHGRVHSVDQIAAFKNIFL